MNHTLISLEFSRLKKEIKKFCLSKLGEEEVDNIKLLAREDLLNNLNILDSFVKYIIENNFPGFIIPDIRSSILKVEKDGILIIEEVIKIKEFIKNVKSLKDYFINSTSENVVSIISELSDFTTIFTRINQVINEEGNIKDNASDELFNIRTQIRKLKESISLSLRKILDNPEFKPFLQDRFFTFKGDRWVIPVKTSYKYQIKGFIIDYSNTGETVFIEPDIIVEKNTKYKEMVIEEKKEIEKILRKLSISIKNKIDDFKKTIEVLKIIDLNCSKSLYAIENKLKKPIIDNYWDIKRARHPFIENPVPIDIKLGKEFDILIITGPNTGGKTAALKTIGLLTLMANSGLFIPADEDSVISYVDNIFIDIGDEQNLSQNLSTFSSHIKRINLILKKATENSLVLIDEIGAGTDPKDGASLGVAIIEYLLERKIRAVITSHFEKVKNVAFFKERVENATVEFDSKTLTPRYRLITGVTGRSMGIEIAARLNLHESIIKRAMDLCLPTSRDYELKDVLDKLNEQIKVYESKRKHYENLLTNLLKKEQELEKKEKEINKLLDKIKAGEKLEMVEFLKEKRRYILDKIKKSSLEDKNSLKDILKDIDSISNEIKKEGIYKEYNEISNITQIEDIELNIGDKVLVNGIGESEIIDIGKNFITVKAGVIKIKVEKGDIIKLIGRVEENVNVRVDAPIKDIYELNIIGKKREEAIKEIENYIESLIIKGGGEGIIIHGRGKGILKDTVIEIMKKYNIKNYIHSPDGGLTKFIVE
ncbi:MAG TPA: endonuclease MutS2 [Spirochaetota bacterium]|nr:endonuclease MutS2 [Spirochaetota bacterium]HOM37884.1 endonuclease MutS2 [Spirochaetota bacterium]HPQ48688.1 endonuclease MutS2 [Spirochaetota bacterium]